MLLVIPEALQVCLNPLLTILQISKGQAEKKLLLIVPLTAEAKPVSVDLMSQALFQLIKGFSRY